MQSTYWRLTLRFLHHLSWRKYDNKIYIDLYAKNKTNVSNYGPWKEELHPKTTMQILWKLCRCRLLYIQYHQFIFQYEDSIPMYRSLSPCLRPRHKLQSYANLHRSSTLWTQLMTIIILAIFSKISRENTNQDQFDVHVNGVVFYVKSN